MAAVSVSSKQIRFALTREAVRSEILWTRRRELHRRIAERLAAERSDPELVAEHWQADTVGAMVASPANPTGSVISAEALAHLAEVATRYHIPVAYVYDAFMGEDGMEDPRDLGLVGSDGLHPTKDGSDLMAELFRNLGYAYAPDSP